VKKFLIAAALFFGLATGKAFASCSASMPYAFTATSYLSYVTTNANNNFLLACVSTVDNTQIGGAGLYASQIIPTTAGQATFGGSQTYTFPAAISVGNGASFGATITTAGISDSGGISSSSNISGVTGTFSGTVFANNGTLTAGLVDTSGATIQGAIQQTVSGTTYTVPYDAQSTSASTNTHMEHGTLTTGTYSGGFACSASHNFTKTYTASPTIILTNASASAPMGNPYPGSVSASAFTACEFLSGQSSGTGTLNWISIGE